MGNCKIAFEIVEDCDGIFIFPKGAKELDCALISAPLEWLKSYPITHKALESFFQEYFSGYKSLENYKNMFGEYLKEQGGPSELRGNFETVIQLYTNYMNNYAKHHDRTSEKVLKFILYQTENIIRLLISLKM